MLSISDLSVLAAIIISILTYLNQARTEREKDKREDFQAAADADSSTRTSEATAAKQITDASAVAVDAYKGLYEEMKAQLAASRAECKEEIATLQRQVQDNTQQMENLLKENERIRRAQDQLLHYNESLEAQVSSLDSQLRYYRSQEKPNPIPSGMAVSTSDRG